MTVIIPSSSFRNHNLLPSTLQNLTGPLVRVVNNIDDVSLPSNFEFINESIIGDGVETVDRAFMYGCDCKGPDNCEEEACSCFLQAEESDDDELPFPYAKSRRNRGCLRNFYLENRHHICECNERCSCSASCMNKVIQRGRQIPLEIFRTRNRGWGKDSYTGTCAVFDHHHSNLFFQGLRCPIILRKGDFIDTYRGEVITNEEADRRGKERARECNYLMDLDKFTSDEMLQIAEIKNTVTAEQFERLKRMVECGAHQSSMENGCELWKNPNYEPPYVCDGKNKGGPTRFINHSCEPNCLLLTASFNHADKRVYALAFFAKQDIPEGEEITFDYNVEEQEIMSDEMADKLEKERGYRPARCLCGTPTCRRYFFT